VEHVLSEASLRSIVDLLVRLIETAGALVVFGGAAVGFFRFIAIALRSREAERFVPVRLDVGRFLALGLEFQLAGDILRSAIAPTFKEIGQLAAIAAIRTGLNFFLGREIREERAELEHNQALRGGEDPVTSAAKGKLPVGPPHAGPPHSNQAPGSRSAG
jgi:uncharacterized membrane protein